MDQPSFNYKRLFLIFYVISRGLTLLMPGYLWDHVSYLDPVIEILGGRNPYYTLNPVDLGYPPLFYNILALFVFLIGPNSLAFGVCFFIFDLGTIIMLYKMAPFFYERKEDYWKPILFYSFFPVCLMFLTLGLPPQIALFFFVGALYFYMKKRQFIGGIFAAVGFLVEVYPALLLFILGIILLAKKQYKEIIYLFSGFIVAFLAFALPYFNFDLYSILNLFLVQVSRSTSSSLQIILPALSVTVFPGFVFNLYSLIPIIGLLLLGVWSLLYLKRRKEVSLKEEFEILLFYFLCLPIFFLNIYFRFFYWCVPFLVYLSDLDNRNKQVEKFLIWASGLIAGLIVFIYVLFPNGLLLNLTEFPNLCAPTTWQRVAYFTGFCIFYIILFVVWLSFWKGNTLIKEGQDEKLVYRSLNQIILIVTFFYEITGVIFYGFWHILDEVSKYTSYFGLTLVGYILLLDGIINYYINIFASRKHNLVLQKLLS